MTRPSPRRTLPAAAPDPDLDALRAAQRDRGAFAELYRRYVGPVYGYCFYLLGDHHDAEDVTERTFVAALAALDRFRARDGGTVRAWLFRIAHNQLANALRARGRHRTAPLDELAVHPAAAADDPARLAGMAEDARRLRAAIDRLSEDRRQVVVLRFADGLSAREIGAVLDRSEGAVRVLQHRALRDLAAMLDEAERETGADRAGA